MNHSFIPLIILVASIAASACSGKQKTKSKAPDKTAAVEDESVPPDSLPDWARDPSIGDRPSHGRIEDKKPDDFAGTGGVESAPDPGPGVETAPATGGGGVSVPLVSVSEKWKVNIGYTTYKSTIHFFDGKIVVNSNGSSWKAVSDSEDGVYILDPKTGNVKQQIIPPGGDEKDCNGIALTKDAIFFGTDQEMMYKVDWQGNVKWKKKVNGDVEAAPALSDFNGDKKLDIAVGSEGGVFYALDGKKGKVLWDIVSKKGYYGASGFLGAAALYDGTGDGVDDVYVPSRDEYFRMINGKTGKIVWEHKGTSGMHSAPIIVDADEDGKMEVIFAESYTDVYSADASTGSIKWKVTLNNPGGGIEGFFSPVGWYPEAKCVLLGTAWWQKDEGVYCLAGKDGKTKWRYYESKQNISSGAVIGDVDGDGKAEAVFGTESGKIVGLDENGTVVLVHHVGGPVECTPTMADVDGDGDLEILAAANNGSLYLLETHGKAPAVIGYHRGTPQNKANF